MKLLLALLLAVVLLDSVTEGLLSSSCKKPEEFCRTEDCCPGKGVRMVCAPHLKICGQKKTCCITEVQEQQEKQDAIIRNRNPRDKLKRLLDQILFDDE